MKELKFELKKLWRQKKLLWLLIIVIFYTLLIYNQNVSQKYMREDRAAEKFAPFIEDVSRIQTSLKILQRENNLDEIQLKQLEYAIQMGSALAFLKVSINKEDWDAIPLHEKDFWTYVKEYEKHGGQFTSLQGIEREKAIQKNDWLIKYNLSYDDEKYPLSPALLLKQGTEILLNLFGIVLLVLFFGSTITAEREQRTWLTLMTQPIPKWRLLTTKYAGLIVILIIFILAFIGIGLYVPLILGDYPMNLQYPLLIDLGDTFIIISTLNYIMRYVLLFSCACLFTYSLILLYSIWIKNSFTSIMLIIITIFLGYFVTNMNDYLQNPWNPFQYFRGSQIIVEMNNNTGWIYILTAFLWSSFIAILSIVLPEKDIAFFKNVENVNPIQQRNTLKKISKSMSVINFELRKIWRKRLLKQVYTVLLLLLAIGYFFIFQETKEKEESYFDMLKKSETENILLQHLEKQIVTLKEEMENPVNANAMHLENQLVEFEKALAFVQEQLDKKKAAINAYNMGNYIPLYEYQLFENYFANQELDTGVYRNMIMNSIGKMAIDASIKEKQWLIENHIQPVFSGEFIPTPFHYWKDDEAYFQKEWEEANRKVDSNGLFSLYIFFKQYLYLVPMILFLLLLGGGLASEKGKKQTINFLLTQPLTLNNLFYGKWFTSIIVGLISSIGGFSLIILIGTIFDRFGDWRYPVLMYNSASMANSANYSGHYSQGMGFQLIPLGEYLIKSIILFLMVLLFLLTLTFFCSLLINNQFTIYTIVLLVAVSGYVLSMKTFPQSAHYLPFVFFNINKITNGEISALLGNPNINFLVGCSVLSISTFLLIIIGKIIINKNSRTLKLKTSSSRNVNV